MVKMKLTIRHTRNHTHIAFFPSSLSIRRIYLIRDQRARLRREGNGKNGNIFVLNFHLHVQRRL